jgi:AcrR family transcriptional regulator
MTGAVVTASPAGGTRDRILGVAAELFAQNGYHATGMAELGQAAQLGRGALYHHIGSKEQLLYELSIRHMEEMVAFGESLLAEEETPAPDRLRRLGRRLLRTIADNLPELTIFFREGHALTGERRVRLQAVRDHFEELCAGIFEQGVRAGELRVSGPLVVKGFLGLHNYSYLWIQKDGDSSPEEIADLFVDIFLHGACVDGHTPARESVGSGSAMPARRTTNPTHRHRA